MAHAAASELCPGINLYKLRALAQAPRLLPSPDIVQADVQRSGALPGMLEDLPHRHRNPISMCLFLNVTGRAAI